MSKFYLLDMPTSVSKAIREIEAEHGEEEAMLVADAVRRSRPSSHDIFSLDATPYGTVLHSVGGLSRGKAFRRAHLLGSQITRLNAASLAFGVLPDRLREEWSRFCELMYRGFQERFLNRHPGEKPEDFLNRPRKRTLNITRRIINIKSQLYHKPPIRELKGDVGDAIKERMGEIWRNNLFNLTLLEVDRFTRLLGTVSVRPFYDKTQRGNIRLWMFLSHQLRVIPRKDRPWEPLAVIERHDPFKKWGKVIIWTDKVFLEMEGNKVVWETHELGRIPHTFFRNSLNFRAFFSEGEGREICMGNVLINDKLSDLNEIIQMQGFAAVELVNPDDDMPKVGPRQATIFRPEDNTTPYGINFKNPNAPISELRQDVKSDMLEEFQNAGVPIELAVSGQRRALSGFAIKLLNEPIRDDNEIRARSFSPFEEDLADNCLRILNEHDETITYDGNEQSLDVEVDYIPKELPTEVDEEVKQDEFDVAMGISTPPEIMQRREPTKFQTFEEAEEQWQKNIQVTQQSPVPILQGVELDEEESENRNMTSEEAVEDILSEAGL